ncbi:MAG: 1-acyl-sn-glycerol-3-phosphate acyltransferase [Propionibacteriaceae bacterium]|nr:1-acyl-sn-glycerol-3-phosphate acyltransferase [Propionibacteriaceae bacterium]
MGRGLRVGLAPVMRRDWRGQENVPQTGPALMVVNHLSSLDPPMMGEYFAYSGRWPYFLAKASLFKVPGVGFLFRRAGLVPVYRGTTHADDALLAAEEHLRLGHLVVIYPEGTTTRDPQEWPMEPRTGAARLALSTGVPVIPVGHWGVNLICPDNGSPRQHPDLFPRHTVVIETGEPIDLSAFGRDPTDAAAVHAAGQAIMDAITVMVERVRGQTCPPGRWDPKLHRRVVPGEADRR